MQTALPSVSRKTSSRNGTLSPANLGLYQEPASRLLISSAVSFSTGPAPLVVRSSRASCKTATCWSWVRRTSSSRAGPHRNRSLEGGHGVLRGEAACSSVGGHYVRVRCGAAQGGDVPPAELRRRARSWRVAVQSSSPRSQQRPKSRVLTSEASVTRPGEGRPAGRRPSSAYLPPGPLGRRGRSLPTPNLRRARRGATSV